MELSSVSRGEVPLGEVHIGGEYFTVAFDTLTDISWIKGSECTSCETTTTYSCDNSDTCTSVSMVPQSIDYYGKTVTGVTIRDTIEFSGFDCQ